jgi:hypothetical protein
VNFPPINRPTCADIHHVDQIDCELPACDDIKASLSKSLAT